ncbi:snake [Carabus blaptoides fortunei]
MQVGTRCILPVTGDQGVCKLVSQCSSAIEQSKVGIKPVICGRYYNEPIVCCKEDFIDVENNGNLFPNKQGSNGPGDGFIFPDSIRPSTSKQRICEKKCTEYSKLLVRVVQAIPLVTNPEPITAVVPKCDYNSIPLIVGGTPAEPGEFPHMALVGYRNYENEIEWNCGGTLISELYVLTAAHCTHTRLGQPAVIRLGELNLASDNDGSEPKDFEVAQVIRHPKYRQPEKYHDIGLIRMSRPVDFNKFIHPACLWTKFIVNQNKTIATGWGHTEYAGKRSDILQKVALDIIENNKCGTFYNDVQRQLPRGVQSTMMCAGSLEGSKDTCQGDSGGPIQITNHENQCLFYIVGITSFGKGCGSANSPAVYTRVSEYLDWIENTVW